MLQNTQQSKEKNEKKRTRNDLPVKEDSTKQVEAYLDMFLPKDDKKGRIAMQEAADELGIPLLDFLSDFAPHMKQQIEFGIFKSVNKNEQ